MWRTPISTCIARYIESAPQSSIPSGRKAISDRPGRIIHKALGVAKNGPNLRHYVSAFNDIGPGMHKKLALVIGGGKLYRSPIGLLLSLVNNTCVT